MTGWDLLSNPQDRGLGRAAVASGRLLNDLGNAQMEAADNLVEKAARAIEAGDEEKADRFIQRACTFPYDERELLHPGPWAAHMLLHGEVTDAFFHSHADDEGWLDAAFELAADASIGEQVGVARELIGTALSYHRAFHH